MIPDHEKAVISQIEYILARHNPDSILRALEVKTAATHMGISTEAIGTLDTLLDRHYKTEVKRLRALEIENKVLREYALQDALTGIPNRKYLDIYLDAALAESEAKAGPVSLLALDLDHFKWVNDLYGHNVGDIVLQKLKEVLPGDIRGYDHVFLDKKLKRFQIDKKTKLKNRSGREGGEEFYVVLPNTTYDEALIVAERLRSEIEKIFIGFFNGYAPKRKIEGMPEKLDGLTASIGVATTNTSYFDKDKKKNTLYSVGSIKEAADLGAYLAKEAGRNRVKSACLTK